MKQILLTCALVLATLPAAAQPQHRSAAQAQDRSPVSDKTIGTQE
jgi:hypothetical protein